MAASATSVPRRRSPPQPTPPSSIFPENSWLGINGHGHVGPPPRDPQLRQYALYGVTTTTSMYFDQDDIVEFKARQKAGSCGARAF